MTFAHELGLALSGGGSRAAAFHCGTLRALERLELLKRIDVVSSVSGGSVFAAGWAASLSKAEPTEGFVARMQSELAKGFVLRALSKFPWLFALLPGYPRTTMLAGVLNTLAHHLTIGQMPEKPIFVLNTTVLNSGQVGKFIRDGFSTYGLGPSQDSGENPTVPCTSFPLSLAAAASAAFPIGLPPVLFRKKKWFPSVVTTGPLAGHSTLALTDGGVLENLGTQTLLKSRRFSVRSIVASDAGTRDVGWRPSNPAYWLRSFIIWLASGSILERFTLTMNDKQNRWMREVLFDVATQHAEERMPRRNVLLVRVAADWNQVVGNVRTGRLRELTTVSLPERADAAFVRAVLTREHPGRAEILEEASDAYERLTMTPKELNAIGTNFIGLSKRMMDALAEHAYWQVLATYALYWEPWP